MRCEQESTSRSTEVDKEDVTMRSRSDAERGGRAAGVFGRKSAKTRTRDRQQELELELERIRQDYIKYEHTDVARVGRGSKRVFNQGT